MDQRLFKAASTTSAEAVTGIIPEERKKGQNSQSNLMKGIVSGVFKLIASVLGFYLNATEAKK